MNFSKKNHELHNINRCQVSKKIVTVIVFVFAIISLNACKSTGSCTSVEKQEINNNQTDFVISTETA